MNGTEKSGGTPPASCPRAVGLSTSPARCPRWHRQGTGWAGADHDPSGAPGQKGPEPPLSPTSGTQLRDEEFIFLVDFVLGLGCWPVRGLGGGRTTQEGAGGGGEIALGPGTLCCSAAKLARGHTSPQATKYKETLWD